MDIIQLKYVHTQASLLRKQYRFGMCTFGNGFEVVLTYADTNYIYILLQFSMTMIMLTRYLGVFYTM